MLSTEPDFVADSAKAESPKGPSAPLDLSLLRKQLPADLDAWRGPSDVCRDEGPAEAIWTALDPFFAERGYTLWLHDQFFMTYAPGEGVVPNGYMYAHQFRAFDESRDDLSIEGILSYEYRNPLTRAARASNGWDVVLRVLAIGEEGKEHVDLLKSFARGPLSLISANHMLPLLDLVHLEDITFGVFPKVGHACSMMNIVWSESSVGDVVDMLAQCLEGLVFLHHHGIAHRDSFRDNFLIQWIPESLRIDYDAPSSRPRVYMNDFELAVRFNPSNMPPEERVCVGRPSGGSLPGGSERAMPPEVLSGEPYDPFKLDVWQLGTSLNDFKSTVLEIDAVLASMTDPDPATRPTAYEAMKALLDAIGAIPPVNLICQPEWAPVKFI